MKRKITDWTFLWDGERYKCQAPATLYSVLLENNIINDPFVGLNSREATKLSERDCAFETVIVADSELLGNEHIYAVFEGLDTICDIKLNGRRLCHADNMHRTWKCDIKPYLCEGDNLLRLDFYSPLEAVKRAQAKHELIGNSDTVEGFPHLRKAYFMFGWDWCPSLPDMGIWRDVYIIAYDRGILDDVEVRQLHRPDGIVELSVLTDVDPSMSAMVRLISPDGSTAEARLEDGKADFSIDTPMLWWPNGYGEQYLYNVEVSLYCGDALIDTVSKRIGLRTVTVSTPRDRYGKEFCFVVNGVKIFAMGANYIPEDNLLVRCTRERTERLIKDCADANFNMLRVWGGGIYPADYFFELCDEYGILVWQDFMFACATLWLTEDFKNNVVAEFIDNIKRIRHHASLALLCGNNEMEYGIDRWSRYSKNHSVKYDYLKLFEHILPELCGKYAPETFYWQSSPSEGGGFENIAEDKFGDTHFWKVFLSREPIEEYTKHNFRFLSEFGFQSLPSMRAIEYYSAPDERNMFSPVMEEHQKKKLGNSLIMYYLAQYFLYPADIRELSYATQLLHAYAMTTAVEHLRRSRKVCKGTLYWQLNDCWTGMTGSSIDYLGERKALHYAAKRFFAPVLLSANIDGRELTLSVCNERMESFCGSIRYAVKQNDFSVVAEGEIACSCDVLSSIDAVTLDLSDAIGGREDKVFIEYSLYSNNGACIFSESKKFVRPMRYQYQRPEFRVNVRREGEDVYVDISSSCYAERVYISIDGYTDARPDRQYFSITSDNTQTVCIKNIPEEADIEGKIKLMSVYDIGRGV